VQAAPIIMIHAPIMMIHMWSLSEGLMCPYFLLQASTMSAFLGQENNTLCFFLHSLTVFYEQGSSCTSWLRAFQRKSLVNPLVNPFTEHYHGEVFPSFLNLGAAFIDWVQVAGLLGFS